MPRPAAHVSCHLPAALVLTALVGCECDRESFSLFPDAGPPDAAVVEQPDAGPPPEFSLKNGDKLKYPPPLLVTMCNESLSGTCSVGVPEQSTTWTTEYTIVEAPSLDPSTNAWVVPAEYFWQVTEQRKSDDTAFALLSRLWLTDFGPWQEAGSSSNVEVRTFVTTTAMARGGIPETYPFFDVEGRWDAAAQVFDSYIKGLDPQGYVQAQKAARKMEGGYLEPSDPSMLHFISIIYHRLGFICQVYEGIGPWDTNRAKNDSGFRNNQRDFQSNVNAPRLTRASGPKAGQVQFCKCGVQSAGSDCE
jgi:hypothetical protein